MTATKPQDKPGAPAANLTRANVEDVFVQLLMSIPEAPEGDVLDVIAPILAAETWEDLQDVPGVLSSKSLAGIQLRVTGLTRKSSDYESITSSYLMCEGARLDTGETITFAAGGDQSLAVLAKLYSLGALPAYIRFDPVKTRKGNDALNCIVLGRDPAPVV